MHAHRWSAFLEFLQGGARGQPHLLYLSLSTSPGSDASCGKGVRGTPRYSHYVTSKAWITNPEVIPPLLHGVSGLPIGM